MNSSASLQAVIAPLEHLFSQCSHSSQQLAQQLTQLLTPLVSAAAPAELASNAFPKTTIENLINRTLSDSSFCSGAGFAYHADAPLNPQAKWSLYWIYKDASHDTALELTPLTHQHLDFRTFEWFLKTKSLKGPYFHGPYVDYICNTSYTMTSAAPIFIQECFYGVAAVDILVSRIEDEILKFLPQPRLKMVLTNAFGRIIFSTLSGYRVGDILRSDALAVAHQHPLFSLYLPA
ncbi:hypothetical protein HH682_05205 [Rosenbergiella sp. S61]|uniref:Uncharacterized protein n=1 Tax=Rosenbergiella gaditana TaxID=2726987 RepID=A0ABS5SUR4_9GAMM|nr:cache domain-containing protein [Rosenbergiella gaditana]MBT0723848.1 hypothetical protein [Rosenbergiella gaditana]